ncbi:MAG TPA: hypothetical protein VF101_09245 [Gaiellaceae bacterium]
MAPLLLNVGLDKVDGDHTLRAVGALLLSPDAEEVLVALAVAVCGLRDAESAAAAGAPHRAFEVVVVDALLLASELMSGQNLLNLLEDRMRDERLVRSGVLDALPGNGADVVRISEHPVNARLAQWFRRVVGC